MNASPAPSAVSALAPCVVPVPLPGRAYDVLIGPGLLPRAGALIAERLGAKKCGIVTDHNVAGHHLAALERALGDRHAGSIILPAGESTKCFAQLAALSERLLEQGLERGDILVAFGGGVIGDLAGFAAGILRRGIRFVQIPTSLLAQVDCSVGGKTGINTPQGKNLIGTFHQPSLVLADTDVLDDAAAARDPRRLCRGREIRSARRRRLLRLARSELAGPCSATTPAALTRAIETSVAAKAGDRRARRDARPASARCSISAIRSAMRSKPGRGYSDRLLHGEGVAIGMCLAFRFSEELGLCPQRRCRPRRGALRAPSGCRPASPTFRAERPDAVELCSPHGPGQKGARRQADLHPGARHRRGLHHPRRRRADGAALFSRARSPRLSAAPARAC